MIIGFDYFSEVVPIYHLKPHRNVYTTSGSSITTLTVLKTKPHLLKHQVETGCVGQKHPAIYGSNITKKLNPFLKRLSLSTHALN